MLNKSSKAKREILKSRVLPVPLHAKPTVLWQKLEYTNGFHRSDLNRNGAKPPRVSMKGGKVETIRKYFAKSPEARTDHERSPVSFNRVRDFTSQLTVVPGPNRFNQRVEQTKAFPQSKVSGINTYVFSSYYQQIGVRLFGRGTANRNLLFKKIGRECEIEWNG